MASAAKKRANREREHARARATPSVTSRTGKGSSSGETSSSGKATSSAQTRSPAPSHRSNTSRRAGYDGNVDPGERSLIKVDNPKNLDLGAVAWGAVRGHDLTSRLPKRPTLSIQGQAAKVGLNTFTVDTLPTKPVYQYDVTIGSGTEKRGLIMKVWESKAVQTKLKWFIFDGNKLAWSSTDIGGDEVRILVDLDAEEGRQVKEGGKENKHRFTIRRAKTVAFAALHEHLQGRYVFDTKVLEAINFFDHMLREYPRGKYTQIKRSFFARGESRFPLGSGVEAFKGVYESMRIVNAGFLMPACLSINLDVANGTFWTENVLHQAAINLTGSRDVNDLIQGLRRNGEAGRHGRELKKLRKIHVIAKHRGGAKPDEYCIEKFVYQGAKEYKFEKNGKWITIYDYFAGEFKVRLQFPDLPLVKMTRGKNTVLPMELLKIKENQRYTPKLDERQTSQMIKFAATPPRARWQAIDHGLKMLNWDNDPILKHFGVKINSRNTTVDARVLPAPTVKFSRGDARPGTSGRWDLKSKVFLTPNTVPLKVWGVCVIGNQRTRPDKGVVQNFISEFVKTYISHGGKVENKTPFINLASGGDVGAWVTATWNGAGNQHGSRPQMLMFILPDKDSITYGRIKRSCDCRYGVVSQCVQYMHVQKCQGQYMSNVCMKFNAKLGGSTSRVVGPKSGGSKGHHEKSTLILGADVSHAAPGAQTPSMAALTMSMDPLGIRYAANCETNGFRTEMIMTDNIKSMLKPMLTTWVNQVGSGRWPERIIYFRDGVSEGQYEHVLDQEVRDMKMVIKNSDAGRDIPMVVLVGSKRHHVRFFPQNGDRNGNALPGTLVETGVTNPYENDFYLCSHAAIKGTARPMHYHVLLNEANMDNNELQTLIYEQCYQYIRATTPISQHPAIYYAHIVSNRAVPHDPKWGGSTEGTPAPPKKAASGSQSGSQGRADGSQGQVAAQPGQTGLSSSQQLGQEAEKLLAMPNQGGILSSMWFI